LITKMIHDSRGGFGTDALNYPGGQVTEDIHAGFGHEPFQKLSLKLPAIAGMLLHLPVTISRSPTAGMGMVPTTVTAWPPPTFSRRTA
jgi:hypothetical protein